MNTAFEVQTIGYVENKALTVDDVPSEGLPSSVRILPQYKTAIGGLEVGMYVYVITIFHLADGSVQTASPGTEHSTGAFSIRSSCRPNRIGMTLTRITEIDKNIIHMEWLDFCNETPVVDLKRYNWRWECIFSNPRDNRLHIERQLDVETLTKILKRPAVNFHGESCEWVQTTSRGFAELIKKYDVFVSNPNNKISVHGNSHVAEATQGITGASFGNGRLTIELLENDAPSIIEITDDRDFYTILVNKDNVSFMKHG